MKMLFALFLLIQSPQPGHLSKVVIVGVALFFIVGVSLVVYFLRRLKSSEKVAEEEWSVSRSLFREEATPSAQPILDATGAHSEEAEENLPAQYDLPPPTTTLVSPTSSATHEPSATQLLSSEPRIEPPLAASDPEPEPVAPVVEELPAPHATEPEITRAERGTEMLASPSQEPLAPVNAPIETAPFDDGIWAELETSGSVAPAPPAHIEPTRPLGVSTSEQASTPLVETGETDRAARIEQRAERALFEPPTITPIAPRTPFEPPTITPIAPSQQSEMMAEQSAAPTTNLYSPPTPPYASSDAAERGTRELTTASSAKSSTPSADDEWAVSTATAGAAHESRTPAGAVLGLPVGGGGGPLVLGDPVKSKDDFGIGGLSNYGKPPAKEGGKGGTIALVLVILIIGGSAAAYLFVPSVHTRVNAWVARARGEDPNRVPLSPEPKVMVFPSRTPVTNKNLVTASGALDNISKETLDNLSIEVSLERANGGAPEIRPVPVTPAQLEPSGHGTYTFEYDGNKDTGFAKYTIKRVLSNGNEVRFSFPGQK